MPRNDPLPNPGTSSCDLLECGGNESKLADRRGPGVEQHVDGRGRPREGPLTARFVWRHRFDAESAADGAADGGELFELAQGLGSGEHVLCRKVPVIAQHADPDCSDVALVDRDRRSGEMRPAHKVACTICSAHQPRAFEANIPGLRNVHSSPEV